MFFARIVNYNRANLDNFYFQNKRLSGDQTGSNGVHFLYLLREANKTELEIGRVQCVC